MEGFTNFYGLTTPIEVVNPTSSIDKYYGPYNTMAEALVEMGIIGKPGRLFGVLIKGLVQLYIYQGITTVPTPAGRTDFIPLSGTETNSPITGDLEFKTTGGVPFNILYSGDKPDFITGGTFSTAKGSAFLLGTSGVHLMSYDFNLPEERVSGGALELSTYKSTLGFVYVAEYTNGKDEANNTIEVTKDGIKIHCSPFTSSSTLPDYLGEKKGLYSDEDLSTETGQMSYVQKFWVKKYVTDILGEGAFIPLRGTARNKYASGDVNIEDIWTTRYHDGSAIRSVGREFLEESVISMTTDDEVGHYTKTIAPYSQSEVHTIGSIIIEKKVHSVKGNTVEVKNDGSTQKSKITTSVTEAKLETTSVDNKAVSNTYILKTNDTGISATSKKGANLEEAYMGYQDSDVVTMKRFRNMPYSITWNTPNIQFSNLPDKSTDALYSYNVVMDANGNLAKSTKGSPKERVFENTVPIVSQMNTFNIGDIIVLKVDGVETQRTIYLGRTALRWKGNLTEYSALTPAQQASYEIYDVY